jgi:hypothetical protein
MDINKKPSKSNNTPLVLALIIIPVLFIFGTMIVIAMVMTTNRPNIKITVSEASNIKSDSATLTLSIEGDRDKINEKGFVYGTAPDPKFETRSGSSNPFYEIFNGYNYNSYRNLGTYLELDTTTNTGKIDDLYPETKYYVRAYAVTRSGVTYSNEVSFSTTKDSPSYSVFDDLRKRDVEDILDEVLRLKNIRPDIFNNRNGLAKNIRINGTGDCNFSTIREPDTVLYGELAKIGYILPADPNPQSDGCSDYGISLNNNIITITAPNAEYGPISVSSDSR